MSSNRYEAETETKAHAHSNAVRELAKSRKLAKTALSEAEAEGIPPWLSVLNPYPPGSISEDFRSPWTIHLKELHASILEYWSEIRPYRSRVPEIWNETFGTISVPTEGSWVIESRPLGGVVRQRGLSYTNEPVGLSSLGNWRLREVKLACREEGELGTDTGWNVITRAEKVHLPPAVCQAAYEGMNDILEDIGLAAEVREIEAADSDPGKPDDLAEWRNGE